MIFPHSFYLPPLLPRLPPPLPLAGPCSHGSAWGTMFMRWLGRMEVCRQVAPPDITTQLKGLFEGVAPL